MLPFTNRISNVCGNSTAFFLSFPFFFFVHDGKFYPRIRVFQFLNIQNYSLLPLVFISVIILSYNSRFNCRKEKVSSIREFIRRINYPRIVPLSLLQSAIPKSEIIGLNWIQSPSILSRILPPFKNLKRNESRNSKRACYRPRDDKQYVSSSKITVIEPPLPCRIRLTACNRYRDRLASPNLFRLRLLPTT